jgi:plastocyanin
MVKIALKILLSTLLLVAALPTFGTAAEINGRVFDANGKPVTDAVVFVDQLPPGMAIQATETKAMLDQVGKAFVPRVLPVSMGTSVSFPNHDQIHHHVYSFSRTKNFEIPLYKGEMVPSVLFDKVGAVSVACNIHDWMKGLILVVPTPYFAITDSTGTFSLSDLPPGDYGIVAWHESSRDPPEKTRQIVSSPGTSVPLLFTLHLDPPPIRPVSGRASP